MPETFDLLNFSKHNPNDFIKLYRHFFMLNGACKQKVDELLTNKHPVFLTQFGKLTYQYATALKAQAAQSDSKSTAQLEEHYYLQQGLNYLLQGLKQGYQDAIKEINAVFTANPKEFKFAVTVEMAKELIVFFGTIQEGGKVSEELISFLEGVAGHQNDLQKNRALSSLSLFAPQPTQTQTGVTSLKAEVDEQPSSMVFQDKPSSL